jgi:uncharacterized surface protein with fasciclin (FAS1) repeats
MTDDPVATAASNNPVLSTLVQAVMQANLVDTLNSAQDVTVIAPANPAFEAIPPDTLQAVLADNAQLTAILSHHVIEGRLAPDELAGTHTTLGGDEVTIEGSGEDFTVAQTVTGTPASVICGNVQTANATVYIVDQVLAPAAAERGPLPEAGRGPSSTGTAARGRVSGCCRAVTGCAARRRG